MIRRPIALALLGFLAATAAAQPAPTEAKGDRFRVVLDSKLTMNGGGQEKKLEAGASFDYTWKRHDKTRTLFFAGLTLRIVDNGKELTNAMMNRTGMFNTVAGKKTSIKFEDATEAQRKRMSELYDSPVCEIEVDAVGKEVKRTILAKGGAAAILNTGFIANCTVFHPWYSPDQEEWRAEMEISGGDFLAKGPLTYKKTAGGRGGHQIVKVSGTLSADGVKDRNGNTVKEAKYVVSGRQTYDTTRKEWVAGQWTVDLAFSINRQDKDIGRAKGKMDVTFELLPEKK